MTLTSRQEMFAQQVAAGLSQSDAYRFAYPTSKGKSDKTVWENASKLAANPKVLPRVRELQAKAADLCAISIQSLVDELDNIIKLALAQERPQCSAAVNAIMAQAKLLGLDKQMVEITGASMPLIRVEFVKPDAIEG